MKGHFGGFAIKVLGISRADVGRLELKANSEHLTPFGVVHSGVLFTLMEMSAADAIEAESAAPVNGSAYFIEGARDADLLVCSTKVRKEGRRLATVECEVHRGADGRLIATATFQFMILEPKPAT